MIDLCKGLRMEHVHGIPACHHFKPFIHSGKQRKLHNRLQTSGKGMCMPEPDSGCAIEFVWQQFVCILLEQAFHVMSSVCIGACGLGKVTLMHNCEHTEVEDAHVERKCLPHAIPLHILQKAFRIDITVNIIIQTIHFVVTQALVAFLVHRISPVSDDVLNERSPLLSSI
jgi:hypothetical protein